MEINDELRDEVILGVVRFGLEVKKTGDWKRA